MYIPTSSIARPSKIYPNRDFMPSGNPGTCYVPFRRCSVPDFAAKPWRAQTWSSASGQPRNFRSSLRTGSSAAKLLSHSATAMLPAAGPSKSRGRPVDENHCASFTSTNLSESYDFGIYNYNASSM
jgi:hypothetical protein